MIVPLEVVPVGFSFNPTDQELIRHYLGPKVHGEQFLYLSLIPELDVYAKEPWNLGIEFKYGKNRNAFFCFTRVTRSGAASNGRLLRGAGNGSWHAKGQRTYIYCNGTVIGQKLTNLKYMLRSKEGKLLATSWIMHEYRLLDSPVDAEGKEMVVYHIQDSGKGLRISDDQQFSCVNGLTASTVNQQQRKRKRDQPRCCCEMDTGYSVMATVIPSYHNMPAPPSCFVDDNDKMHQALGMVSANDSGGIRTNIAGDDDQQQRKMRMASANGASSTDIFIVGDNDEQQELRIVSTDNGNSTTSPHIFGDSNHSQQEGIDDGLGITTTAVDEEEYIKEIMELLA